MRARKFSPADRAYPIFEVCDDAGGTIYFDVSISDGGALEIAFHQAIANQVIPAADFERWFGEAKRLALADRNSS